VFFQFNQGAATMKLKLSVLLLMFIISDDDQKLQSIAVTPTPKFENPSFCLKEGFPGWFRRSKKFT
jgi:hypothetical protein